MATPVCHPPQIETTRSINPDHGSPKRDSGTQSDLPWPLCNPGFLDNDFAVQDMFSHDRPSQEAGRANSGLITPVSLDNDSELSELTSSSDASDDDEDDNDQSATDDASEIIHVSMRRATAPVPALPKPMRLPGRETTARNVRPVPDAADDSEVEVDLDAYLPPELRSLHTQSTTARAGSDFRAGPRTAAGRALLRTHAIVDERREQQIRAQQQAAQKRNAKALEAFKKQTEIDEDTDREGAARSTARVLHERMPEHFGPALAGKGLGNAARSIGRNTRRVWTAERDWTADPASLSLVKTMEAALRKHR